MRVIVSRHWERKCSREIVLEREEKRVGDGKHGQETNELQLFDQLKKREKNHCTFQNCISKTIKKKSFITAM